LSSKAGQITFVLAATLALAALAAAWPETALAQCPLCRSALSNAGDQTARTMNAAIIVLLIPPVSIFCTILAVVYRKARSDGEDENREPWRARR
jgi:heme/copper-type cytochrome/quinol oxidase subunit 2